MEHGIRSDRIKEQGQRMVGQLSATERRLERSDQTEQMVDRCKRDMLRKQSKRMALELALLARRAATESPDASDRLRRAAEALQLLRARLDLVEEAERRSTKLGEDF